MRLKPIPERYRPVVTVIGLAPVSVMFAALIGEVFLDDYFGPHWTRHFFYAVAAGSGLAFGAVLLAFRGSMFAQQAKVTETSIDRMFGRCMFVGCIFAADVVFEALIYPAFALHGWVPERFVPHALEMVVFVLVMVWVGYRTRTKFLRELRETKRSPGPN